MEESRTILTVIKLTPDGREKIRYAGEVIEQSAERIVLKTAWKRAELDLGYTVFAPGDCFTEYFYTARWFTAFELKDASGVRKGWYCDVAEPAVVEDGYIRQVDLYLDVWVDAVGKPLVLDEDEFAAAELSDELRRAAREGLRDLLATLEARQEMFAALVEQE